MYGCPPLTDNVGQISNKLKNGDLIAMKRTFRSIIIRYFPALCHKNFRYFWIGQCISLIGTWMQNIGQSWLVFTLTKSPFLLGLVGALQFTPMLLFSLFAGVIVDKFPKRKILLFTQTSLMTLAFILAVLVWTGSVRYWHILVLATLLGFVNTLDMPTRQSFVIELVGKEDLMNAVALNSTIFNAARIIGPALAGLLMGYLGIAFCFFVNGLSFLAIIYGLWQIDAGNAPSKKTANSHVLQDIKEGLVYIYNHQLLFRALLLIAVIGTFAMNFSVLIPVLAKNVLHQQETGFGFLMSAMGLGSFIGAITVATKSRSGPQSLVLFASAIVISLLLIITGYATVYFVAAALLLVTGFFNILFTTTANSTMQLNSKDEFRGRVMSAYTLVFGGTTPIGNLFAGTIANQFGAKSGFIASGIVVLVLVLSILAMGNRPKGKPFLSAKGDKGAESPTQS